MGELIPLILLVIALIPKIKKKQLAKKAEQFLNGNMKSPSDLLPEIRPNVVKPVTAAPVQKVVQQEMPLPVSAPKQAEFHSGFESRPEKIVLEEGIDPCHDDLYEDEYTEEPLAVQAQETDEKSQSNELIRGIVLGEILAKPNYRAFARK